MVQLGQIKTFRAQNDEDFVQNISRIESLPVLFFSQDRSLVKQFINDKVIERQKDKAISLGIPKDIVDVVDKAGHLFNFCEFWEDALGEIERTEFISNSYENGQLKPYFIIYSDDGEILNFDFVQKNQVVDAIIKTQKDGDYITVISSASGKQISYKIEYLVTLEE
jgi:hypothetical protein